MRSLTLEARPELWRHWTRDWMPHPLTEESIANPLIGLQGLGNHHPEEAVKRMGRAVPLAAVYEIGTAPDLIRALTLRPTLVQIGLPRDDRQTVDHLWQPLFEVSE